MSRNRAYRRHQAYRHMWRRLKEDRNEHYNDLTCPCWSGGRAMTRFKEQPQECSCYGCRSQRYNDWLPLKEWLTMQERRFLCNEEEDKNGS
jgi:hypothetical protein